VASFISYFLRIFIISSLLLLCINYFQSFRYFLMIAFTLSPRCAISFAIVVVISLLLFSLFITCFHFSSDVTFFHWFIFDFISYINISPWIDIFLVHYRLFLLVVDFFMSYYWLLIDIIFFVYYFRDIIFIVDYFISYWCAGFLRYFIIITFITFRCELSSSFFRRLFSIMASIDIDYFSPLIFIDYYISSVFSLIFRHFFLF